MVIALADGEIDAIEAIYLMRDELTLDEITGEAEGRFANHVFIKSYLGIDAQDIGADLIAQGVDVVIESDKWQGVAALYVRLRKFSVDFEGADPHVNALLRGRKVYDPRTGLTAWSQNPALCIADYLVNYMGFPLEQINEARWLESIEICEEQVDLAGGGTEDRYQCNGVILSDERHDAVLESLQTSMAGSVDYASGQWFISAGAYRPPVIEFTEADVLERYEYSLASSDRDLPNLVRGTYVSPAQDWQPTEYPEVLDAAALAADAGERVLDLELPFTTSPAAAQRIAKIALRRARAQRTIQLTTSARGLLVQPGSSLTFHAPEVGLYHAQFLVDTMGVEFRADNESISLSTRISIAEYGPEIFEWNAEVDEVEVQEAEVSLGGYDSRGPEDLQYVQNLVESSPAFELELAFNWSDPESERHDVERVEVLAVVEITVNDGGGDETQEETLVETTGPGDGALTLMIEADYAAGFAYVSHEVLTAQARVHWSDGVISPWIDALDVT